MVTEDAALFVPPQLRATPEGERVTFSALCRAAGMTVSVSGRAPDVRLHGSAVDFKAVAPGRVAYCFGLPLLPTDARARARMVMHKLAYQCMNWAAREVVRADRMKTAALSNEATTLRHALAPNASKILRHLQDVGQAQVSELARDLGIAQPHVSRALRALLAAGLVRRHKQGRHVILNLHDKAKAFL